MFLGDCDPIQLEGGGGRRRKLAAFYRGFDKGLLPPFRKEGIVSFLVHGWWKSDSYRSGKKRIRARRNSPRAGAFHRRTPSAQARYDLRLSDFSPRRDYRRAMPRRGRNSFRSRYISFAAAHGQRCSPPRPINPIACSSTLALRNRPGSHRPLPAFNFSLGLRARETDLSAAV